MAKKTVVLDDMDGQENAETVTFALKGQGYEIDLAPPNQAKLEKALKPYIEAGRAKGNGGGGQLPYDSSDVRRWATEDGLEVNPRGRISQEVVDKYMDAHVQQ